MIFFENMLAEAGNTAKRVALVSPLGDSDFEMLRGEVHDVLPDAVLVTASRVQDVVESVDLCIVCWNNAIFVDPEQRLRTFLRSCHQCIKVLVFYDRETRQFQILKRKHACGSIASLLIEAVYRRRFRGATQIVRL